MIFTFSTTSPPLSNTIDLESRTIVHNLSHRNTRTMNFSSPSMPPQPIASRPGKGHYSCGSPRIASSNEDQTKIHRRYSDTMLLLSLLFLIVILRIGCQYKGEEGSRQTLHIKRIQVKAFLGQGKKEGVGISWCFRSHLFWMSGWRPCNRWCVLCRLKRVWL